MPPHDLAWTALNESSELGKYRIRQVSEGVSINGHSDFVLGPLRAAEDESLIAAGAATFWDAVPGEPNHSMGRRNSEKGVIVWPTTDPASAEWFTVPSPYGDQVGETPEVLAFSADNSLLAIERDESVSIWSRPEQRVLCTFRYGVGEKIVFRDGGAHIAATAHIFDVRFAPDNGSVTATINSREGGSWRWEIPAGSRTPFQPCAGVEAAAPQFAHAELEGLGPGNFVSPSRFPWVFSADRKFVAADLGGRGLYMGMGDRTPTHIRVWSALSNRLQTWSNEPTKDYPRDAVRPIAFLSDNRSLLVLAEHAIRIVDVSKRQEVAHYLADGAFGVDRALWLPQHRFLCLRARGGVRVIAVSEH